MTGIYVLAVTWPAGAAAGAVVAAGLAAAAGAVGAAGDAAGAHAPTTTASARLLDTADHVRNACMRTRPPSGSADRPHGKARMIALTYAGYLLAVKPEM